MSSDTYTDLYSDSDPASALELYVDPGFTDPELNAIRSKDGWTVGNGQAVWSGPGESGFYLNLNNTWADHPGLTPGVEYDISVTAYTEPGSSTSSIGASEPWETLAWMPAGVTETMTARVVWEEQWTHLLVWLGGPGVITNPSITAVAAVPTSPDTYTDLYPVGSAEHEAHTGTAELSGAGALSGTGSAGGTETSPDTYTDLYPVGASIEAYAGTAELSGSGTVSGSGSGGSIGGSLDDYTDTYPVGGTTEAHTGTATLSGLGALTGTGSPGVSFDDYTDLYPGTGAAPEPGVGTLTGTGSLTGSGVAREHGAGTGLLSGIGSITGFGGVDTAPPPGPQGAFEVRVVVMDVNTIVDILPVSKLTWTATLNDTSTLSIQTHVLPEFLGDAERVELTRALFENYSLAVQVRGPGLEWTSVPHAYGVLTDDESDATDVTGALALDALGADWDLTWAPNLDADMLDEKGRWAFDDATAGEYMLNLLTRAHGNQLATAITADFTDTHDSAGQPWNLMVSMKVEPKVTPRQLLDSLANQGMCDWRMQGNTLQMYNADTAMRRDRTSIDLPIRREVVASPQRRTRRDLHDIVLVVGDEGMRVLRENDLPVGPRGRRAVINAQGGVSQQATAEQLADALLEKGKVTRRELTRDIRLDDEVEHYPFVDYLPGDVVLAPGHDGKLEPLRVFEITITQDNNNFSGSVILADRFLEREVRETKRMNGLIGASTISGGTNAEPTPVPWDPTRRFPAQPNAISSYGIFFYWEAGATWARLNLSWDDVTVGTDGQPITVSHYVIRARLEGEPVDGWAHQWGQWETSESTHNRIAPGTTWFIAVRAISDRGESSPWSEEIRVEINHDTTPPEQMSAPVLMSRLAMVWINWDGNDHLGQPLAAEDFERGWIEEQIDGAWVRLDAWVTRGNPRWSVPGTIGEVRTFRLVAVDTSGNEATPSLLRSVSVRGILQEVELNERIEQIEQDFADADAALRNQIDSIVIAASGGNVTWMGGTTPVAPADRPHKVGDTWWDTAARTQRRYDGSNWVAFQLGDAGIWGIDAAKVVTGFLDAARIKAGSIWADKILVGTQSNLIVDPGYANAELNAVRTKPGWTFGSAKAVWAGPGQGVLYLDQNNSTTGTLPGQAGFLYRVVIKAKVTTAGWVRISLTNPATQLVQQTAPANTEITVEAVVTWPTTPRSLMVTLSGPGEVSGPVLTQMVSQVLIANGSVDTPQLKAGAVTADRIESGAIKTTHLDGQIIEGQHIKANALDFKEASGLVLTAPNIQSTNVVNRGLKLTPSHKRVYDANGVLTMEEDYTTGNISIAGDFATQGTFPRFEIKRSLWGTSFTGMRWYPSPSWYAWPELRVSSGYEFGFTPGGLSLLGASWHNLTARPQLHMRSGYQVPGQDDRFWPEIDITLGDYGVAPIGRIQLKDVGESKTSFLTQADFIALHSRNGQSLEFPLSGTVGDMRMRSLNGSIFLEVGPGRTVYTVGIQSTAGGENLVLEGGWRLMYQVSESALKLDQQEIPVIPEVLALQPKTWIDKQRRAEDPTYHTRHMGFIAEEAEALIASLPAPARAQVAPLVQYFDRGERVSKSIPYAQMVALLWPLVRELWEDRFGPIG